MDRRQTRPRRPTGGCAVLEGFLPFPGDGLAQAGVGLPTRGPAVETHGFSRSRRQGVEAEFHTVANFWGATERQETGGPIVPAVVGYNPTVHGQDPTARRPFARA